MQMDCGRFRDDCIQAIGLAKAQTYYRLTEAQRLRDSYTSASVRRFTRLRSNRGEAETAWNKRECALFLVSRILLLVLCHYCYFVYFIKEHGPGGAVHGGWPHRAQSGRLMSHDSF